MIGGDIGIGYKPVGGCFSHLTRIILFGIVSTSAIVLGGSICGDARKPR